MTEPVVTAVLFFANSNTIAGAKVALTPGNTRNGILDSSAQETLGQIGFESLLPSLTAPSFTAVAIFADLVDS